jgi:hypothetical protein
MTAQYEVNGGVADLLFVNRNGYATEVEIKVSVSDWRADQHKRKWRLPRPHVRRFYYAVPETLAGRAPADLPKDAGILAVAETDFLQVRQLRPAKLLPAVKFTHAQMEHMRAACYYRFWRAEMARLKMIVRAQA